jgi:hypothetical protein
MHSKISSDRYANVWVLKCKIGYLKARVESSYTPEAELIEIESREKDSWTTAHFADHSRCRIQSIYWSQTPNGCLKHEGFTDDALWVHLSLAGLTKGYDPNALMTAIAARDELETAKQHYLNTLESLGGLKKEEGTYEDYREWIELPGLPMIEFEA